MLRLFITLLSSASFLVAAAQSPPKIFRPTEKLKLDVSVKSQREIDRRDLLLGKKRLTTNEQKELEALLEKHDETSQSVWDVLGTECSWYCGGGNYAIRGSSSRSSLDSAGYSANNASDLSYRTAWVEGKKDEGIGEYLEYLFRNNSPRITRIIVSNGFVKSEDVWQNNNRVRKLKLSINGIPYGILALDDTRDDQVFEVGTLGRRKDGKDLILRFQILEVYKGNKYNDTAITEIYFDGVDVH